MCTYLTRRQATYYFRRPVPEELRSYLGGRREWMQSLATKDRETAKRAIPEHTVATEALIDGARAARRADMAAVPTSIPGSSRVASEAPTEVSAAERERAEHEAEEAAAKQARWEHPDRAAERKLLRLRMKTSTEQLSYRDQAVRDLMLEQDEKHRAYRREHRAIRKEREAEQVVEQAPAVPLLEVFDAYAKEQGLKPTTAYEWRTNIKALVTFLGHDDGARVSVEDLDRWRDVLLSETTKRGTIRSPRTVKDKYFAALRATLNWAVEKRKLKSNVATEITVRVPKQAKLRERDFSSVEAAAILTATMRSATDGTPEHTALARRWVPWLCAYTGARVNEIGQLRGEDVKQIDGIWTIRITPEAGTVKANVARVLPLHSHLVEQGFPAVAANAASSPIFFDPALARKPGAANRHAKKVGERLAEWVRGEVGITDPNLQPNHGWRHTFKSMAVEVGIPERVADAIQGHAPRSVGQAYGSVSLKSMAAAVEQLPRYEILPPPLPSTAVQP